MTRITAKRDYRFKWAREGTCWRLSYEQCVVAFAERDGSRWLCYTSEDTGGDGLLGPMPSLVTAKAYLERRAAFEITPE